MRDLPVDWSDDLGEAFALLTGSGYWAPPFILLLGEGLSDELFPMLHSFLQQQHAVKVRHDIIFADNFPALGP